MTSDIRHPTSVIPPGSTIGIIGGGQLGRMLAIAAAEIGYRTHIYCPDPHSPAFDVSGTRTCAAYEDAVSLRAFANAVDVVTYEFENIPTGPLAILGDKLRPGLDVLSICQHRLREKETLNRLGIQTAPFAAVSCKTDLEAAIQRIGLPAVLKTATMGYDGKGQWKIYPERSEGSLSYSKDPSTCPADIAGLAQDGNEYILEGFVDFSVEISVIVARGISGETACYCPVQNTHKNHILHETIAPAPISAALAKKAASIACKVAEGLGVVGILAVEMFVTAQGDILVNELAPRPHNSGHWTIDACMTSQFEQCIRAVCGLPLGSADRLCAATMLNLIGDDIERWQSYAAMPNAKLHLYGKKEARPGRKMGHVTFLR